MQDVARLDMDAVAFGGDVLRPAVLAHEYLSALGGFIVDDDGDLGALDIGRQTLEVLGLIVHLPEDAIERPLGLRCVFGLSGNRGGGK